MRYISLFSGIEAATVAWHPLGWIPVAFAEIEPFPSAVLAHYYPDVPNVGDVTKFDWSKYANQVDVVVGGPPCQAFSVAGLRNSLDDARGNLSLEYVRAVNTINPRYVLTENVPGWLSTKDNAFGCFLAAMVGADAPLVPPKEYGRWSDAGVVAGPTRTAAWRVLDAQYFGLAQRRRRVFVVCCPRNGPNPAAILFESKGLSGNPAPRREQGQRTPHSPETRARSSHWDGDYPRPTLNSGELSGGIGFSNQEIFSQRGANLVDTVGSLAARDYKGVGSQYINEGKVIAVGATASGLRDVETSLNTKQQRLDAETETFILQPTVFEHRRWEGNTNELDVSPTVQQQWGTGGNNVPMVLQEDEAQSKATVLGAQVRRLLPTECEALQGFPRNYTLIPFKGKPVTDGARYKALGNSMATTVINWLGRRIDMVDRLLKEKQP